MIFKSHSPSPVSNFFTGTQLLPKNTTPTMQQMYPTYIGYSELSDGTAVVTSVVSSIPAMNRSSDCGRRG